MDKAAEIEKLIAPSLAAMGYDIVRVLLLAGRRPTLQVMAERQDAQAMTVDNCTDISRAISALLDVEDPIADAYALEVSSPGLDRPLTRPQDYQRFAGCEVKLETRMPVDGRKRFRGRLLGIDGATVRIATAEGEAAMPFEAIAKAKLVLTDELLAGGRKING